MECADDSCTEEVLGGQLFCNEHRSQISAIEDLQCPRGCGRLSYGRTGWSGQFYLLIIAALVIAFLGLMNLGLMNGVTAPTFWLLFVAIAVAVWAFVSNEGVTGRYKCGRCSGEMYDSKSIVKMMSGDKAKTIERLLESGTPSANKRQCPGCEAVMVRIPIDYVEPDSHHHTPDDALGFVIMVVDAMIPNPTKHLDLEGCPTCGMFWFDSRELAKIKESTSMKGGS
ncbi:MAG TPA: hypothetical protein EYQ15_02910 [Candidatus Poseidoniales archaeon]|nr:hypothetical protein [Candidatus Poseidoniales archaeon]